MVRIEGEHRNDDLYLVAQPFYEARTQRPVDEPAGEDGLLARTSLAPKERARYATSGIHSLLDVHGQRKEVEALARRLTGCRGRQHHRVVVEIGDRGPGCLPGESSGLEANGAGAERAVVDRGDGLVDLGVRRLYEWVMDFLSVGGRMTAGLRRTTAAKGADHPCGNRSSIEAAADLA